MKKIIALCLLLTLVLVPLTACDDTIYHWNFSQEFTEVKSIQIQKSTIDGHVVAKELDVSLAPQIWEDVKELEYKKYFPNPTSPFSTCGYIVVIEYNNGDREIISEWEPQYVPKDGNALLTYLYCPEEQFTSFIQIYLGETI